MSQEFKVPELGENVKAATVAKVLVSKGDRIKREQPVVELETDKAVVEVPSDVEGTVDEVLVKDGDEAQVGQTLFTVSTEGGTQEAAASPIPPRQAPGGSLPRDDAPANPGQQETDTESEKEPRTEEPPAAAVPPPVAENIPSKETVPAAPSVRRFAREIGVEIGTVPGSGPQGRIGIEDVKAYAKVRNPASQPAVAAPGAGGESTLPDFSAWGEVERLPMSKIRLLTAERMSRAWTVIPHVTQFAKADVTEIERLRHRYKANAERAGGHLTLTVVLLKTTAVALKVFPQFNSSVDMARREIVHKKYCNVGVAMDTDRGLVVPVIRGVESKNLIELAVELSRVTAKAREGKLTIEELRGGCFTISNAGALGGESFTPIINWPEVAILGLGRTLTEPRYEDGAFKPKQILPLSLSYDHRVIDGADGVRFLRWIVEALEDPMKLLWEG